LRTGGRWVKREMPYPQFITAVTCLGLYTASRWPSRCAPASRPSRAASANAGLRHGPINALAGLIATVLIPVAYRTIIPPLTSDFLGVFKNSSLAAHHRRARASPRRRARFEEYTFAAFEAFTVATVLYCLVTGLVIVIMRVVEGRTRIAGTIAVGAQ